VIGWVAYIIFASILGTVLVAYGLGFDVIAWIGATLLRGAGLQ